VVGFPEEGLAELGFAELGFTELGFAELGFAEPELGAMELGLPVIPVLGCLLGSRVDGFFVGAQVFCCFVVGLDVTSFGMTSFMVAQLLSNDFSKKWRSMLTHLRSQTRRLGCP